MKPDLLESIRKSDLVVVGSGFFGLTVANQAANDGYKVMIIERRNHPGGNAWSYRESSTGIEVHQYGSHLFHTSNERVWSYVNSFTRFNNYQHSVWTRLGNQTLSMPINLSTIQAFYKKLLSPAEAKELIRQEISKSGIVQPQNLEEKAISLIGRPLYEALIKGYTEKQWQTDPMLLPAEIITRLPVRYNFDARYFSDTWEGLPLDGYHTWIEKMLDHENINLSLSVDYQSIKSSVPVGTHVVYTGPVDEYFNFEHGRLSWRTLDFETEVLDTEDYQGASVVNFADVSIPYTRIHEYRHLHPERRTELKKTVISREYSRFAGPTDEPYYPINTAQDRQKLEQYRVLAKNLPDVSFGGRLGTYQYLDMHMAIASALTKYETEISLRLKQTK
jgi:UDP-galactopyranose mutase